MLRADRLNLPLREKFLVKTTPLARPFPRFVATLLEKNPSIVYHPSHMYIYIHSISIDQKWKFSSKLFKLDRKLVSRSSCHQSFARTHVRRSHNLWIALRNFHLSKQLSLRYSFESRMFASSVFIILARLADVIKRERLNIETFTNR